jgi:hypothetical protein
MINQMKQMKIYVTNIPPSTIKIEPLKRFLLFKDGYKKYELVSQEFGTQIIDHSKNGLEKMYRIEPNLNMDIHLINNHKGDKLYSLLVDKTEYVHIPIVSQFPVDYILTKMICFEYRVNKKSGLKMVIECLEESNELLEKALIPINFYFLGSMINQTDDILLEEINMFLLELN